MVLKLLLFCIFLNYLIAFMPTINATCDESSITGRQPLKTNCRLIINVKSKKKNLIDFLPKVQFNLLPNGTTTYATSYTDANIQGTSLKCLINCPVNLDCSWLILIFF